MDLAKNTTPVTIPIPGMFSKVIWGTMDQGSWVDCKIFLEQAFADF
jgi:hypothetical protein